MSGNPLRYLVVIVLLALTGLGAIFLSAQDQELEQAPAGYTFVTDVDAWLRTDRQRTVTTSYDFRLGPNLDDIPLELGKWRGVNVPETNQEVFIILEPEHYLLRRYERYEEPEVDLAGASRPQLWLTLIGSHKLKSFHPPQICYRSIGWQTQVGSEAIPIGGSDLYALKAVASGEGRRTIVLYFYIWPDASRDTEGQGAVMFRVSAALQGTEEATVALAREFIPLFFLDARP
jgi:hypothetical protein